MYEREHGGAGGFALPLFAFVSLAATMLAPPEELWRPAAARVRGEYQQTLPLIVEGRMGQDPLLPVRCDPKSPCRREFEHTEENARLIVHIIAISGEHDLESAEHRRRVRLALHNAASDYGLDASHDTKLTRIRLRIPRSPCWLLDALLPEHRLELAMDEFRSENAGNAYTQLISLWVPEEEATKALREPWPARLREAIKKSHPHADVHFIGPYTSSSAKTYSLQPLSGGSVVKGYSPWITTEEAVAKLPSTIEPVLAKDGATSCVLLRELRLRSICEAGELLLLTEAGTDFGRQWKELLTVDPKKRTEDDKRLPGEPLSFPFLPHLVDVEPTSSSEQGTAAGKEPTEAIETPYGPNHLDYVRRLRQYLSTLNDDRLRQIHAIGVLGSRTDDKLMIFQAIRPLLPHAILFTSDLDAIYYHPNYIEHTRNLIVGSAHHLCSLEITPGEPPVNVHVFRDSYQTSAYHAFARSMGRSYNTHSDPRVYEISRNGPIDLDNQVPTGRDWAALAAATVLSLAIPFALHCILNEQSLKRGTAKLREMSPFWRWTVYVMMLLAVLTCSVAATSAEPLVLGLSVWPSAFLNLTAAGCALVFIHHQTLRRAWSGWSVFIAYPAILVLLDWAGGLPRSPTRGLAAELLEGATRHVAGSTLLWLVFLVLHSVVSSAGLCQNLNTKVTSRADIEKCRTYLAKIATEGGRAVYGPFIVLFLMCLSRWNGFDRWAWPLNLKILVGLGVGVLVVAHVILHFIALRARAALELATRQAIKMAADQDTRKALRDLQAEVAGMRHGILAGIGSHPVLVALLIPFTGMGALSVMQYLRLT